MRDVDDAHDAEDERQAERGQRQDGGHHQRLPARRGRDAGRRSRRSMRDPRLPHTGDGHPCRTPDEADRDGTECDLPSLSPVLRRHRLPLRETGCRRAASTSSKRHASCSPPPARRGRPRSTVRCTTLSLPPSTFEMFWWPKHWWILPLKILSPCGCSLLSANSVIASVASISAFLSASVADL